VSFVNRTFPDIVRDVLTNLTQGVTGEVHHIDYDPQSRPVQVPDITLQRRPVTRVSFLSGYTPAPNASDPPLAYVFTLNDYQLVSNTSDTAQLSTIRFLPFGKKPAPNTDLTVNYYPRTTGPVVVNDLNSGSVVRTLLEAVSKELGVLYAQLNLAYDNAYLDTATGTPLERVAALLGYTRFRAGRAVGTVTFSRRAGAIGNITIPAGTPVTDVADKIVYQTVESHEMLAGESTAQVSVRGGTEATPPVDAGVLTVIQRAIAGLDRVVNERPTSRAVDDESDVEFRARVRDALAAANTGTVAAMMHGLLQMPEVRDVSITEYPNGVAGEIGVSVSLVQPPADGATLPPAVVSRIEELRPAGVRVLRSIAKPVSVVVHLKLVLAGSALPNAEIEHVRSSARQTLTTEIQKKSVGEKIRMRPLAAALLTDTRVADVEILMGPKDGPAAPSSADFEPAPNTTVHLDAGDITFAAETFEKPPVAGQAIPVNVRAVLTVSLLAGASLDDVRASITTRLGQYFSSQRSGNTVEATSLLTALRDDSRYGIDPLKLNVTLTAQDQFVQIVANGPTFSVLPDQVFTVASVDVAT
jgi:uncharacterized phage protein gp47/JayE